MKRFYLHALCLGLACIIGWGWWTAPATATQVKTSPQSKQKTAKRKATRARKRILPLAEPAQEKTGFEEEAEEKRDWFLFQRTYPFDELPAEARRQAWESRLPNAPQSLLQTWTPLGPQPTNSAFPGNWGNTSGRINAVAVSPSNPNLILIGSATGGIWRSADGGANFAPVSDNQVDLAVGDIAFAPSDNSIVYAGMGDGRGGYLGSGVLKSTDAGQTWTRVSNGSLPSPGTTMAIAVSPTNPNRVYLAQSSALNGTSVTAGGFYFSADGGVNWTRTLGGAARGLAIHPATESTLYLAMRTVTQGGSLPGIFRSTDSGQTWTSIYESPYSPTTDVRVAVTPANPQSIYVYIGGTSGTFGMRVEVSTNGGESFTNRGAPGVDTGQFGYNTYLAVSPADANTIYLGTRDVFKSTNGGTSYTNLTRSFNSAGGYTPGDSNTHPDQHALAFLPGNANTLFFANDGGLYKSTDGGANLSSLNNTLSISQFVGLAIDPNNPARSYGGTQDNGNQKRLTGSASGAWREFFSGDGGRTVLNPLNPSTVFITFVYGSIYRFENNGDSFSATVGSNATFGEPDSGARIAFYPPFTGNGVNANLYFGTYRLFVSSNLGDSWTAPGGTFDQTKGGSDVLSALCVARGNTNVIYSGSRQGRAMISTNGGADWTDISTGIPNRSITSLTMHPTDPATAYLTVSGYGTGHIFKTTNSGNLWTDISGNLPNIPANTLLIDPLNSSTLYIGTDIGVFRSDNSGGTWATFTTGMPPVVVMALASHSSGLIQAATFGRGIYELPSPVCAYNIGPASQNFTAAGGLGTVNVTTGSTCGWTAVSNAPWITVTNGSNGNGSGAVSYAVQVNANSNQRTGTITVAGQTFTVTQAGGTACSLAQPISMGQTLTGQLSAGDCLRAGGSLADRYTFDGVAGQQIAISLNSSSFNAYALLASSGGTVIAEDDSGGGGTNARIPAGGGFFTLPAAGTYTIFASAAASGQTGNYSVSLTGPSGGGLQFYPLAHPVRLLETRAGFTGCFAPGAPIAGGASRTQIARGTCEGLTIPPNAAAITGNITTVNSGGGYLTLYPGDAAQPLVANSNYGPNEVVNNVFTVGLGAADGAFKIYVQNTTDVVVEVTGYYAPPGSGLYFHPLPKPIRLLETRAGFTGCFSPGAPIPGGADTPQQARLTCNGVTIPAAAQAIVGNATTIAPAALGYLTLFPADATRPLVASSNFGANQIVNGPFTVGLSPAGEFKIFSSTTTGLAVDVLGYYSAEASDANGAGLLFNPLAKPVRLLETRAGFTGCSAPGSPIPGNADFTQQARGQCNGETIPSAALAIVGNATVLNSSGGFLTLWPSNAVRPLVATSNFNAGQVFNRHFTVGLGLDGAFNVYSSSTADLIVDVTGFFAP